MTALHIHIKNVSAASKCDRSSLSSSTTTCWNVKKLCVCVWNAGVNLASWGDETEFGGVWAIHGLLSPDQTCQWVEQHPAAHEAEVSQKQELNLLCERLHNIYTRRILWDYIMNWVIYHMLKAQTTSAARFQHKEAADPLQGPSWCPSSSLCRVHMEDLFHVGQSSVNRLFSWIHWSSSSFTEVIEIRWCGVFLDYKPTSQPSMGHVLRPTPRRKLI